jgi:bacteriocin biosynthesis cyclodehydratase domain-containing protein
MANDAVDGDVTAAPRRLKLSARFCLLPLDSERIVARTGGASFTLRGDDVARLLQWLLPQLDGRKTFEEMLAQPGEFSPEDIAALLGAMLQCGVVEDADPALPETLSAQELSRYETQLRFFSHFSPAPHDYQAALKRARVALVGSNATRTQAATCLALAGVGGITLIDDAPAGGEHCAEALLSRLEAINPFVRVESSAELEAEVRQASLVLACLDGPAVPICERINEVCLKHEVVWTSAHVEDFFGIVGPSVIPFQTPCFKCYELRRKSNLDDDDLEERSAWETLLRERRGRSDLFTALLPPFAALLGAAASVEALKLLTRFQEPTAAGAVWEIDLLTLKATVRPLLKLPRCPACGRRSPAESPWANA